MSGAKFIWFFVCIVGTAMFSVFSIFNAIRMQDISRTTDEVATCHVQAENFALDALDMNLELKHKHEGVAYIKDEDLPKVKQYVEERVAMFDSLKEDVEDLTLSNVFVYQGVYSVIPSGSGNGDTTMVQTINEVPYYKAKLTGKIKKVIRSVTDAKYMEFETDIFIRASHILRK